MDDETFIKVFRKMLEWEWYKDVPTTKLFLHCLLKVNYKDKLWKGRKIKRGQFWTSIKHLSEETGLTVKQVRTSLEKLTSTNEITHDGTSSGSLITVNAFTRYQSQGQAKGKAEANEGQARGEQGANEGQQLKKDNKDKKDKKEENIIIAREAPSEESPDDDGMGPTEYHEYILAKARERRRRQEEEMYGPI